MDFKTLGNEFAVRDGRARRATVAAVEAASLRWSSAESAINRLIREQTGLRSTERRFVGETAFGIIRRYEPLRKFAAEIAPNLDSTRRSLLIYFIYLVLERGAEPELARPHLAQAGLPEDAETWPARFAALRDALGGDERFAFTHSFPLWMARRLREAYGDEAAALAEGMNHRAPVDLRVNLSRYTRDEMRERIRFEGVTATPTPHSPWGLRVEGRVNVNALPSFREGDVDVQDEGSQLLALLTGAEREETIADVCAGGGGKLAALAGLMENRGRLVAMDVNADRLAEAEKRMRRLHLHWAETIVLPPKQFAVAGSVAPWLGECDRVLVDAPCSGTGAWRRHPADRWRLKESEIERLVEVQADVLANAAQLVRPGGRLVYATCSILPDENERQAERFTAAHPEFTPVPLAALWPETAALLGAPDGRYLRCMPHRTQTDGFFAAVWQLRAR